MATQPKTPKKPKQDWREQFKIDFPQFSSMVDGGEGEAKARSLLGDDLVDLFIAYAKKPDDYDLTTDAGKTAWVNKVRATKLYTSTDKSRREWALLGQADKDDQIADKIPELRNLYGTLELDDAQIRDLATYSLSTGASELQTQFYAYSIISNRQAAKGMPPVIGETDAATTLKESLKRFNYAPPGLDDQIRSVLTGQPYLGVTYTEDMLVKKAKDNAKIMYSQFGEQFDQGFTMDDIFEPYRNIAAKTLEKNPMDIRMSDPKFSVVFNKRPDGTSMTAEDFQYLLRKDPDYGWDKTRAAQSEAARMIMMMEKSFGQVM